MTDGPHAAPRRRFPFVGVLVGAWVIVVACGMKVMLDYQSRPGTPALAPATLPASSVIAPGRETLVMLAHPRCPCTRATVNELDRLMARTAGRLQACVLFVVPPGKDESWAHTALVKSAAAIPNVKVVLDPGGVEAGRFGAFTSGQTLLYDASGRLRFAGGITPGRGHAGDSAGSDAIAALVNGEPAGHAATSVFGCELAAHATGGTTCPK